MVNPKDPARPVVGPKPVRPRPVPKSGPKPPPGLAPGRHRATARHKKKGPACFGILLGVQVAAVLVQLIASVVTRG